MTTPRPGPLGSHKLAPGKYVVWRRVEIDGAFHYREIVCTNPAFGYRVLGEWEAGLRLDSRKAAA